MRLVTRFEGRWRGGPGAGTPCIGPRAAGPHSCLPLSWRRVLQGDFGSFPRRAACCRGCGVGYRALPSRTNLPGSWRREGLQAGPGSSTSGIRGLGATWWVLGHFGHVCEELGPPRDEWGVPCSQVGAIRGGGRGEGEERAGGGSRNTPTPPPSPSASVCSCLNLPEAAKQCGLGFCVPSVQGREREGQDTIGERIGKCPGHLATSALRIYPRRQTWSRAPGDGRPEGGGAGPVCHEAKTVTRNGRTGVEETRTFPETTLLSGPFHNKILSKNTLCK